MTRRPASGRRSAVIAPLAGREARIHGAAAFGRPGAPAVIAHRGASAHAPENTLAACELAIELGADAVEVDVRATADGEPVLLHDPTLERTTGDPRPIRAVTRRELQALDPAVRPPSLAELLDRLGSRTSFLIEVKALEPAGGRRLLDAIDSRGLGDRTVVQSFDRLLLRRFHHAAPWLRLAGLVAPQQDPMHELEHADPWLEGLGPRGVRTDATLMAAARARGVAVRSWTVNREEEMARLAALGVDALITDLPDRARAVVGARAGQAGSLGGRAGREDRVEVVSATAA